MRILANGENVELTEQALLPELLRKLGAEKRRVAVLINDEVVPAAQQAGRLLRDGDRVEVLSFAGGG